VIITTPIAIPKIEGAMSPLGVDLFAMGSPRGPKVALCRFAIVRAIHVRARRITTLKVVITAPTITGGQSTVIQLLHEASISDESH